MPPLSDADAIAVRELNRLILENDILSFQVYISDRLSPSVNIPNVLFTVLVHLVVDNNPANFAREILEVRPFPTFWAQHQVFIEYLDDLIADPEIRRYWLARLVRFMMGPTSNRDSDYRPRQVGIGQFTFVFHTYSVEYEAANAILNQSGIGWEQHVMTAANDPVYTFKTLTYVLMQLVANAAPIGVIDVVLGSPYLPARWLWDSLDWRQLLEILDTTTSIDTRNGISHIVTYLQPFEDEASAADEPGPLIVDYNGDESNLPQAPVNRVRGVDADGPIIVDPPLTAQEVDEIIYLEILVNQDQFDPLNHALQHLTQNQIDTLLVYAIRNVANDDILLALFASGANIATVAMGDLNAMLLLGGQMARVANTVFDAASQHTTVNQQSAQPSVSATHMIQGGLFDDTGIFYRHLSTHPNHVFAYELIKQQIVENSDIAYAMLNVNRAYEYGFGNREYIELLYAAIIHGECPIGLLYDLIAKINTPLDTDELLRAIFRVGTLNRASAIDLVFYLESDIFADVITDYLDYATNLGDTRAMAYIEAFERRG